MLQSFTRFFFIATAFVLSVGASAADHSPQAAVESFLKNDQVAAAISQIESEGYSKDGDATAALFYNSFGDEGYFVRYLVSLPMAKGTKLWEKSLKLVSAKVTISGIGRPRVELIDSADLGEVLRNLR